MLENRSLAFKLILAISASTGIIFILALGYTYYCSQEAILQELEQDAKNLARATAYKIEGQLEAVERVPNSVAALLESHVPAEGELSTILQNMLERNPDIFGIAIAFEPYAFDSSRMYFSPYVYRGSSGVHQRFLGSATYDYFHLDWYQIPHELQQASWSEPYYDEGGGEILMATYSAPFFKKQDGKKIFQGVVTADVSLSWLRDLINSVRIYDSGYAFMISRTGLFITHKKLQYIMRESIFSLAEERQDSSLRSIGRRMIHGEEGLVPVREFVSGEKARMYFSPVSAGASIGVVIPDNELFAKLREMTVRLLTIGAIGFLCLSTAIILISGRVTKPLKILSKKALELAKGNLDTELPEALGSDEIGNLNKSFTYMRTALKEYIANLAETTKAKERIESELKIARAIQMSFLPKRFPPFPQEQAFEVYATLEPAREVGGDLYDFFLLGPEEIFFTIGDVSGKGVPAALFMAVSKTLIKGTTEAHVQPSQVLERVNAELCQENEANMFVTVFAARLNFRNGTLSYANGGHNPPLLLRRNGQVEWLDVGKSVVLAAFEESRYTTRTIMLAPGDTVLLYTDGVTEAQNAREEFYTDQRLFEVVGKQRAETPQQLIESIVDDVKRFAGEAPQADDIALLAVTYRGSDFV